MPDYAWPDADQRTLIGTRVTRVDAPAKVSGQAKYTYDVHRPGMLYGKVLRCPYAHAKVVSIDTSAAEKMPGVKAVHIVQGPGANIHWAGDEIAVVAAVDEPTAGDAIRAIKATFQQLPHLVSDAEPPPGSAQEQGPLSLDNIDDMLDNQVPDRQMIEDIQKYGLSEKPTEDGLKELKEDGASEEVLAALRSANVHPEAGNRAAHGDGCHAGGGDRHEQIASRCMQLLGHEHRVGRADGARHDAELPERTRRDPELGVVTGPACVQHRVVRLAQMADDVSVGIE